MIEVEVPTTVNGVLSFASGANVALSASWDVWKHQRLPFEIASKFAPDRDGRPLHAINLVVHRSYSGTTETEREGCLVRQQSGGPKPPWDDFSR